MFALAVNKIADGSLQDIVNNTVMSLAGSSEWGQTIAIAVSSLVSAIYWVLITNTFAVILRRLFMEMRVYEEVPPYRALYLHSAHCWGRTSLAQLRAAVQLALWWLTIVGGVIKTFSYYLCSFILAENPTMKGKDAIALSRKMMNGHKWECFLMELSFVPWHLLSMATFGLTDLFYASAYITATRCEFYAAVRAQVKAEGEAEALRDTYLFERARAKTLRRAYNDLGKPVEKLPERVYGNRVSRFFGEYLGVTLFVNPQDVAREKIQDREYRLRYMRRCEQGLSYPIRLSPLLQYEHKDREPALFTRKYPVTTLVLLFFLFSTIGWCWEVVLHLVTAGTFVNRGVLHGRGCRFMARAACWFCWRSTSARQAVAGVYRDDRRLRNRRVFHRVLSGNRIRPPLVGLCGVFPQPARADLRGGPAGVRAGRHGGCLRRCAAV